MKYTLRDYQKEDVEKIRYEYRGGARSVLHVSPTGSGKIVVFCYITEQARKRGKSVLILSHRDNLVKNISGELFDNGIDHGIIAAGYPSIRYSVQVASVQTLIRKLDRWEHFDIIIIDEAHHIGAASWIKILNHFSKSHFYGCTATPIREDSYGLGNCFDTMVVGASFEALMNHPNGYLATPKYFIPEHLELDAQLQTIKKSKGDYNRKGLSEKLEKNKYIMGNLVEYYGKYSDCLPAMGFCVSINHAEMVCKQFVDAGYIAKTIHSKMNYQDVYNNIMGLKKGKIHLLFSCDIVGEGTNIPRVKTIIDARPTCSLTVNHQHHGRASRPKEYPDKNESYHFDHVGNTERHGFINWPIKWELTTGKFEPKIASLKVCKFCFASYPDTMAKCPDCGRVAKNKKRMEPEERKGELKPVDYKVLNEDVKKAVTLSDFHKIAKKAGYKPGWGYYQYKYRQKKIKERLDIISV